jgi:magnesium transporter
MEPQVLTDILQEVEGALGQRDAAAVLAAAKRIPPGERGGTLLSLTPAQLSTLFRLIGQEEAGDLLEELAPTDAARLLVTLSDTEAGAILEQMDPDDAVDVVQELRPSDAEDILHHVSRETARELLELLPYGSDTAGGIMTPEFVAVRPEATVADALTALRNLANEVEPGSIQYIYVADAARRLVGVLPLRALVLSRPQLPVADVMLTDIWKIQADADQETAARLLLEHDLMALPVIDEDERLIGIITADDAVDVLQEETSEDIARLGGSEPLEEPYLRASVAHVVQSRIGWIMLLFGGMFLTSLVLRAFESSIEAMVSLAVFIPLLIGMGGVVGSQTVTTLVRALALGEVAPRHILQVARKEMTVALLIGLVLGIANSALASVLGVPVDVRYTVGLSALVLVCWAMAVAVVLPLLTHKLGIDPAIVSNPLLTTVVDATGVFFYFTLAHWLVRGV